MVARSPALQGQLDRERWLLAQLDHAATEVRAPESLRSRVARARRESPRVHTPVVRWGGALIAGVAAAVLVLTLALPGGTPGSPTLSAAAALAARGATTTPPSPDPGEPGRRLSQAVGGAYFPNWTSSIGWRPTGERVDRLSGHRAVTVYYASHSQHIAYTILSAPALPQPVAPTLRRNGITLRTLTLNGRLLVTWRRDGKTCVLSGTRVSARDLQQLAAWPPGQD